MASGIAGLRPNWCALVDFSATAPPRVLEPAAFWTQILLQRSIGSEILSVVNLKAVIENHFGSKLSRQFYQSGTTRFGNTFGRGQGPVASHYRDLNLRVS